MGRARVGRARGRGTGRRAGPGGVRRDEKLQYYKNRAQVPRQRHTETQPRTGASAQWPRSGPVSRATPSPAPRAANGKLARSWHLHVASCGNRTYRDDHTTMRMDTFEQSPDGCYRRVRHGLYSRVSPPMREGIRGLHQRACKCHPPGLETPRAHRMCGTIRPSTRRASATMMGSAHIHRRLP